MRLGDSHLCYSLNVFPAELEVSRRISNIGQKFNYIRGKIGLQDTTPLALGFWADAAFVRQMRNPADSQLVKEFLAANNFYVFTLNAFPYGQFHEQPVKEKVYLPDWTTDQRADFTCSAADFLSDILPENIPGSISTLPGGYKSALLRAGSDFEEKTAKNLRKVARHLANLARIKGREIILGIEMEPDCLWESPDEFIQFFHKYLADDEIASRYIGVCYDTSHQELIGGMPGGGLQKLINAGIAIAKIQLSAALRTAHLNSEDIAALQPFSDAVYLHQTRVFDDKGDMLHKFRDIPSGAVNADEGYLVSHFHLPIFCSELSGGIFAANAELLAVIKQLNKEPETCRNLEIETYTYSVLPKTLAGGSIEDNIIKEYKWFLEKCLITSF